MPTLDIGGKSVQVGDDFLKLSPEQQNSTVEEIFNSMKGAAEPPEGFKPPEGVRGRPYIPTKGGVEGARKTIEAVKDVGRVVGSEFIRGTAGAIPDITNLGQKGVNYLSDLVFNPSEEYRAKRDVALTRAGSPEMIAGASQVLGTQLGAQGVTTPEIKAAAPYIGTVAGITPLGALMKLPFVGRSLVPGVVSEGLGQATQGTPAELPARVAGMFVGKGGPPAPPGTVPIPNYAMGPIRTAVANKLAELPWVGAPVRQSADLAETAFQRAAGGLDMIPTGAPVDRAAAGGAIQTAARAEKEARVAADRPREMPGAREAAFEREALADINAKRAGIGLPPATTLSPSERAFYETRFGPWEKRALADLNAKRAGVGQPPVATLSPADRAYYERVYKPQELSVPLESPPPVPQMPYAGRRATMGQPENAPQQLLVLGGTGQHADLATAGAIWGRLPAEQRPMVQGGLLNELGTVRNADGSIAFDAAQAIRRFETDLTPGAKNLYFGDKGSPLRTQIESLIADAKRIEAVHKTPSGPTLKGWTVTGLGIMEPMTAITSMVGARMVASLLAQPATAASLAGWSRAFTNFMVKGGTPATIAGLKMATTNLENTAGIKIDPDKLRTPAARPPRATEERIDWGPQADVDPHSTIGFISEQGSQMYPRGIGWERMRPSTNVENRREGSGYVMPNTNSAAQILRDDALNNAYFAGGRADLGDITPFERGAGLIDAEEIYNAYRRRSPESEARLLARLRKDREQLERLTRSREKRR